MNNSNKRHKHFLESQVLVLKVIANQRSNQGFCDAVYSDDRYHSNYLREARPQSPPHLGTEEAAQKRLLVSLSPTDRQRGSTLRKRRRLRKNV